MQVISIQVIMVFSHVINGWNIYSESYQRKE